MATKPLSEDLAETIAAPSGLGAKLRKLDMSKVSDGFTVIPADTECEFEIVKADGSKKTANGDDKIAIELKCLTAPYTGTKVWDTITLIESTMWKLKSISRATGLADAHGNFTGNSEADFVGKIVTAQVIVEAWQGVDRNKLKGGYKPPTGGVDVNATADDAPAF